MYWLLAVLGLVAAVALVWGWLKRRVGPAPEAEDFDGVVYRIGNAAVVVRGGSKPRCSVVAMHGFTEDFRYLSDYYDAPGTQYIGINSCDYHLAIREPRIRDSRWAMPPRAEEGTIRYDAQVLCQALEHLPNSDNIRVHGHSRGGAVVVEAANLRPDLFRNVEVVLEAPVLPQGSVYGRFGALLYWFLPLLMPLWRRRPLLGSQEAVWGPLDRPRKRELLASLPFAPRRVATAMTNLRDMAEWMAQRGHDAYAPLRRGVVLVPENDRVLYPADMAASAAHATHLEVIRVAGCGHFVTMDCPDVLPPLHDGAPEAVDTVGPGQENRPPADTRVQRARE